MSTSAKIIIALLVLLIAGTVVSTVFLGGVLVAVTRSKPGVAEVTLTGAALDRVRARGELWVGMDTGVPPWSGSPPGFFQNQLGEYDGFDYRLARLVAENIGVKKVKVIHSFYEDLEADIAASPPNKPPKFDIAISGFIPYEAIDVAWSRPYLEFGLCLVVRADGSVKTVRDLEGKVVGVYDDEAAIKEANRLIKGYAGLERLTAGYWDMLVSGKIDGFLYDYPFAAAELGVWYKQNPHRQGSLQIAQYNLTDSTYSVAVRKSEPELLGVVNQAIAAWRSSGQYQKDVRQYLGEAGRPLLASTPTAGETYVVQEGDSLPSIAAKLLGSEGQWTVLWDLNKDRYPNPGLIVAGDRLNVPSRAQPR